MAYDHSTRDELRKIYCYDKLSLEKAAVVVGVSEPTARRWKKDAADAGDDWEKVRLAHTSAGGDMENIAKQLLTDLLIQYQTTITLIKDDNEMPAMARVELLTSLSDSYNKALSASRKLTPEVSRLATALEVLEKLSLFIKAKHPAQLFVFVEILGEFGEILEKELK